MSRFNRPHFVEKPVERRRRDATERDQASKKPAAGLRRSIALALLYVAQFVVILGFSVVHVALPPAIEEELGFSREVLLLGEVPI